jgi:excisionase family DNA binding protein
MGTTDRKPPLLSREILTVEQAAEFLQVHKITVYRYIREGTLPAAKLGKMYRLFRKDLEAFLAAMRHQPGHEPHEGK